MSTTQPLGRNAVTKNGPETSKEASPLLTATTHAILRLPGKTREVLVLSQVKGLDQAVIAGLLGLSLANVRTLLAEGLCAVSRTIERAGPTPSIRPPRSAPMSDQAPPAAAPMTCTTSASSTPATESLVGRCAEWLAMDFEESRMGLRWAALETQAVAEHKYFSLSARERRRLPMGPEMASLEREMRTLAERRGRLLKTLAKMVPTNIHEAASLMVVAARMEVFDPPPSGLFVVKALDFIANATCPRCGEAYVPESLPTA